VRHDDQVEEYTVTEAPPSSRDPAAVAAFIERFAQVHVDAGMPRIASRIFVALTATDAGRLTAADLAHQLRASPAAISGGVRYLLQLGLVRREREPGSRRDHYTVADDVWYQAITQRDQLLVRWTDNLRDGADVLGRDTPAGARMAESEEFFEFMQKELQDMVDRWRRHQAERVGRGAGEVAGR
jgi:DNA-binding transcriptional regulator GbsR (MarR family)